MTRTFTAGVLGLAVGLTIAWATWALFLAPRSDATTPDGAVRAVAARIVASDWPGIAGLLADDFAADVPTHLDRAAAVDLVRREREAGRFFPFVATTTVVMGQEGSADIVAHGVFMSADPQLMPRAPQRAFRVEAHVVTHGGRPRLTRLKVL